MLDINTIHSIVSITPFRPWGSDIVNYFYLTGISVANFIIASLFFVFKNEKFKNISLLALLIAIIFFLPAPINLIDDLKQPGRTLNFFLYGWENFPTSPMKWGVLLLMSYSVILFISLFLVLLKNNSKFKNFIFIFGIFIGCGVEFYTSYIIGILHAFPILHSPIMPMLFLTSALISGSGVLIILYFLIKKFYYKDKNLELNNILPVTKIMLYAMICDIFFRIFWLSFKTIFNGDNKYLISDLLTKDSFFTFGIDFILCLIIPFIIICTRLKYSAKFLFTASLLVAIGTWIFKWFLVISGGQGFMKMTPSFLTYRISLFGSDSISSVASNWCLIIALISFMLVIFGNKLIKG